ncbi:TniB family NTP-binding protein [Rhodoblastus acidophilus]|uniref:TniB family NTP-binding protein n=1 Tax=Rhodoblastus acidophilus TaxID=1074 RepID=UPI001AEC94D0|nr:TniB family NTP-binding protein [Rhodoblastus acidophilus]
MLADVYSLYFAFGHRDDPLRAELDRMIGRLLMRISGLLPPEAADRLDTRCLVLTGASGAGKSAALGRMFLKHPSFPGFGVAGSGCPAVRVRVRGGCTHGSLARALLRALDYPIIVARKDAETLWEMARERVRMMDVRVIYFDEFQNVIETANVDEVQKMLNSLKTFLNHETHPVLLVLSGLPSIVPFLEIDTQVFRRSVFIRFQPLDADDLPLLSKIVGDLAKAANLRVDIPKMAGFLPRLMHASLFQLGTSVELACEAAEQALMVGGDTLEVGHFAAGFARRTGNADEANPFLAKDYHLIDCSRVHRKAVIAPDDDDEMDKRRRMRRKMRATK